MSEQVVEITMSLEELTGRFRGWAIRNEIEPRDFARRMNYSENHAYMLLRGDTRFTWLALGRLVRGYGLDAAREIVGRNGQAIEVDEAPIAR